MEEARYILSVGVKMPMGIHMVDRKMVLIADGKKGKLFVKTNIVDLELFKVWGDSSQAKTITFMRTDVNLQRE